PGSEGRAIEQRADVAAADVVGISVPRPPGDHARGRRRAHGLARIADAVTIVVRLVCVEDGRTVVLRVRHPVAVEVPALARAGGAVDAEDFRRSERAVVDRDLIEL